MPSPLAQRQLGEALGGKTVRCDCTGLYTALQRSVCNRSLHQCIQSAPPPTHTWPTLIPSDRCLIPLLHWKSWRGLFCCGASVLKPPLHPLLPRCVVFTEPLWSVLPYVCSMSICDSHCPPPHVDEPIKKRMFCPQPT